ncbi:serine acetyltransferase 2 [Cucumis melo var. makuwa]|uniref:serine O-acetyltransferase n=2 Tax=Cucumis melo TaxID=3656 RepID=A0A5D3CMW4_CUCMM|nr:serine acetyltransferase 2 [Cucumis melo var. makuwa]
MACLSDHNWPASLSNQLTDCVSRRGEQEHGADTPAFFSADSMKFEIERVFPVYAMGSSKPSAPLTAVASDLGDPIWDAVREEAKLDAEKEPILSSFLYASILSHDCLEQALSFVLANRLQNPTLLATQLMDIFCDVMMHDRSIQHSIRLDLQAFKDRDPACLSYSSALLYPKGYHSLQVHRVAHTLWNRGRIVLALALQSRISEVFGVDIHPAAKIGDGILLDHATGVVIGETAVVGNRVSLMHGVTLGGSGKEVGDRHPKVGDGALIGASTTILGNIKIGKGAVVAAGSLVLKDVPPHSMVAGIPAKVIGYVAEQDPSLTMKHDATKDFFEHVAGSTCRDAKATGQCPESKDSRL